jgi:hypothetical protein
MPVLKTEFECPQCSKKTGASVQVVANAGELSCPNGHRWNDTMGFLNENPRMVFKVQQIIAQQANRTPLTISVPIKLKADLETKYGDKLAATVTAILNQMNEGTGMMIPQTDVERLQESHVLGKKFNNSSELVGLIYAKTCEADDAKAERDTAVADLKAYEGLSVGRVVVDLGDQYLAAKAKAADASTPLKIWAEQNLKTAIESNWF